MEQKKLRRKKIVIFLLAALLISPKFAKCHEYIPEFSIIEEGDAYGKYRNGYVFIGNRKFIESIKDMVGDQDILVLDDRDSDDPDMMIYNSYRIQSLDERDDILHILQMYESQYPSEWERSIESMRTEWTVHNLFYNLNMKTTHTTDVDLNNNDEELFGNKVLQFLLK